MFFSVNVRNHVHRVDLSNFLLCFLHPLSREYAHRKPRVVIISILSGCVRRRQPGQNVVPDAVRPQLRLARCLIRLLSHQNLFNGFGEVTVIIDGVNDSNGNNLIVIAELAILHLPK